MQTGDVVKVRDTSYSLEYRDGRLEDVHSLKDTGRTEERWTVVATGCVLPRSVMRHTGVPDNDTVLSLVGESGRLLLTQERFLKVAPGRAWRGG